MGKWRIERCRECWPNYATWRLISPDGYDCGCSPTWEDAWADLALSVKRP